MITLAIIIILILIFAGGGFAHSRWSGPGPAWSSNVLYLIALMLLIYLVIQLIRPGSF